MKTTTTTADSPNTTFDFEIGHVYKTTYGFNLYKSEDLEVEFNEGRVCIGIERQPSFLVIERKIPAFTQTIKDLHTKGEIFVYRVQTPDYICWIYVSDGDRDAIHFHPNIYQTVELTKKGTRHVYANKQS